MKKCFIFCLLALLLFLTVSCANAEPVTETVSTISDSVTAPVNVAPESTEPSPALTPVTSSVPSPNPTATQQSSDLQAVYESALVGCWHAAPGFPAGYAERYIFYTNYKFVFLQNQMDTTNPLRSYWGTWAMEDGQLIVTILHKLIIVGGEVVPDEIYGEDLIGGIAETFKLDPPEVLIYPFPTFEIDSVYFSSGEDEFSYKITIGEDDYWKLDMFDDFGEVQEEYNPLF